MKSVITIARSRNGWLIVKREMAGIENSEELLRDAWTFNSIDKAISQIRVIMKEHRAEVIPK